MRIRKLAIWITRAFLSMLLFSLIFINSLDFGSGEAIAVIFESIYEFADKPSREAALDSLLPICGFVLSQEESTLVQYKEFCDSPALIRNITENCQMYYELRDQIGQNQDLEKTCSIVLSGELEKECDKIKTQPMIDTNKLGSVCEQYGNRLINDQEFFSSFMLTALPKDALVFEFPVKETTLAMLLVSVILLLLLFLLHKAEFIEFSFSIGRILFNLGMFLLMFSIILPIFAHFFQPDTSLILNSLAEDPSPEIFAQVLKIVFLLVPHILIKLFSTIYLIAGFSLLAIGITIKIIFRKGKT